MLRNPICMNPALHHNPMRRIVHPNPQLLLLFLEQ